MRSGRAGVEGIFAAVRHREGDAIGSVHAANRKRITLQPVTIHKAACAIIRGVAVIGVPIVEVVFRRCLIRQVAGKCDGGFIDVPSGREGLTGRPLVVGGFTVVDRLLFLRVRYRAKALADRHAVSARVLTLHVIAGRGDVDRGASAGGNGGYSPSEFACGVGDGKAQFFLGASHRYQTGDLDLYALVGTAVSKSGLHKLDGDLFHLDGPRVRGQVGAARNGVVGVSESGGSRGIGAVILRRRALACRSAVLVRGSNAAFAVAHTRHHAGIARAEVRYRGGSTRLRQTVIGKGGCIAPRNCHRLGCNGPILACHRAICDLIVGGVRTRDTGDRHAIRRAARGLNVHGGIARTAGGGRAADRDITARRGGGGHGDCHAVARLHAACGQGGAVALLVVNHATTEGQAVARIGICHRPSKADGSLTDGPRHGLRRGGVVIVLGRYGADGQTITAARGGIEVISAIIHKSGGIGGKSGTYRKRSGGGKHKFHKVIAAFVAANRVRSHR